MPAVDIVIATRDRPEQLVRCLQALAQQSVDDFGVIVVDDGSRSPVVDSIPSTLAAQLDLRSIRLDDSHGPGYARNAGVRASHATFVAFVDDDVRAEPDLLARHLEAQRAIGGRGATIGPLAEPPDWHPPAWNIWEARSLDCEYARMRAGSYRPTWRQFHTGNAFVRRTDFCAVGGFDERFRRAEDIELSLRLALSGVEFAFAEDAVGWHYAHRTLDSWLSIPRHYARCDVAVELLHPRSQWLTIVQRERGRRRASMRLARQALAGRGVRGPAARAACELARGMHALGQTRLSLSLLSLAYDVEYEASLRDALEMGDVDRLLAVS